MIEWITETGLFGVLWILTVIIFIGTTYRFIKRNGIKKVVPIVLPIIIIFMVINTLVNELTGKTSFDIALEFIGAMWFIMSPTILVAIFTAIDKDCIEFWKKDYLPNKEERNDNRRNN